MKPRSLYLTVLCLCFVLLFGVAGAQQSKQSASPQRDPIYIPPNSLGSKVESKDTLGTYSFREFMTEPGAGPVPHRHSREDESFYILDGQLEFRIGARGERIIIAAPGSFVFAPRGIPHTFKNVGTTPARALVIISPAGLEKFFPERTALGKEVPTTDPSYPGRSKALEEKYGLEYSSDWSFPSKARD
jgi:quercetin dioxygenase-like cupin family protein